jgi:hypothetical protein
MPNHRLAHECADDRRPLGLHELGDQFNDPTVDPNPYVRPTGVGEQLTVNRLDDRPARPRKMYKRTIAEAVRSARVSRD